MKKSLILIGALFSLSYKAYALPSPLPISGPISVSVSSAPVTANSAATITISTPSGSGPYSTGYTNYLTHVYIVEYATGTIAGNSTLIQCTTTNLNGLKFNFPTALAIGAVTILDQSYEGSPLAATSASNLAITCPATGGVQWIINLNYIQAP